MSIPPVTPLAYEGAIAVPYITRTFDPNSGNYSFDVPTIWVNTSAGRAWILVAKPQNVADWLLFTGGSGSTLQIDTPDGAMVQPSGGIINFLNGTGTSITGSGNNITFNSMGGGISWVNVTGATQTLTPGDGYVANHGTLLTFSLPATANFGDYYAIAGHGAGGWTIAQNAGQSIVCGTLTSTVGVTGSVASTNIQDSIQLLCIVANTTWKALEWQGNITVT